MKLKFLSIFSIVTLFLAACSSAGSMGGMDHSKMGSTQEKETKTENTDNKTLPQTIESKTLTGKNINLVAEEANHQLNEKVNVAAWTFNRSVPGSQIRVKEGEKVNINLKNELPDPVTIHWHGIPLPNNMDGIPGVTQNAVQPGKSFTYKFTASVPGTYMYHTHQDGVNQLDKGLYGSFIVEPKTPTYDRDYSLMLDEWMSNPEEMEGMDMSGTEDMEGMDHSNMSGMEDNSNSKKDEKESTENDDSMAGHDMSNYDIFTINGKSGKEIKPLKVKEGEKVRIRLANIGYMSHKIHLHGHDFKVVAIDGQELNEPKTIKDQLISIAPGERYDIEFTADNPGKWYLECHGEMKGTDGMKTVIEYEGSKESNDQPNQSENLPVFNYTSYGKQTKGEFTSNQKFDVEYTMDLNTAMNGNEMVYTINDKVFPDTDNIEVDKGDLVKVKLVNNSKSDDHPMHLHGHFFQVLSKNGKPVEGSPILKDTVNLKPGDEYVVAFKADNPGNWLFHCHDLHHASAGMVNMVKYKGFEPDFKVDSDAGNKPE
ncbi:multicopper oxidase family protein [Peribacillus cavernae]|uniref:Multicopper oxidase family protein n=1 Tax=Peribacillus cavernae TaxID=1674310 RepID=A0A433HV12_9BACI|nr:multicopper oxidase family protein [Peribacillus cavernae]MDQ0219979.1 FtsP/CotA-like multicopper oxidase with cupredoxin domain [Peribacillus cavernae]RUQ32044.1 multicopper oxidase family protein [Peribacillus cavernae]